MKRERATKRTTIPIPSSCLNLSHSPPSPRPAAMLAIEARINARRTMVHSLRGGPGEDTDLLCIVKYFAKRLFALLYRCASRLPGSPTAGHRRDVGVPHLLQAVGCESGAESTSAIENQLCVL